jgi:hypothetical protein
MVKCIDVNIVVGVETKLVEIVMVMVVGNVEIAMVKEQLIAQTVEDQVKWTVQSVMVLGKTMKKIVMIVQEVVKFLVIHVMEMGLISVAVVMEMEEKSVMIVVVEGSTLVMNVSN